MDTHYDMQQDSLQDIERQLNNIEQQIEKKKRICSFRQYKKGGALATFILLHVQLSLDDAFRFLLCQWHSRQLHVASTQHVRHVLASRFHVLFLMVKMNTTTHFHPPPFPC